jgi:MSHA pilin protein MshA
MAKTNHSDKSRQRGFTLIELVIVIIIIGVLAAIALPRMTGLTGDARAATVKGLLSAAQSANTTIFSAAQINGQNGPTGSVRMKCGDSGSADIELVHGYAKDITNLATCLQYNASEFAVETGKLVNLGAGAAKATCSITYVAPTGPGLAPALTATVSGCGGSTASPST